MSYIEQARINKANAEKAAAFDNMQKSNREQSLYDQGSNDAVSEIERQLQERVRQEKAFLAEQDAAKAAFERANTPTPNPSFYQYMKDVNGYLQNKANSAVDGLANSFSGLFKQ